MGNCCFDAASNNTVETPVPKKQTHEIKLEPLYQKNLQNYRVDNLEMKQGLQPIHLSTKISSELQSSLSEGQKQLDKKAKTLTEEQIESYLIEATKQEQNNQLKEAEKSYRTVLKWIASQQNISNLTEVKAMVYFSLAFILAKRKDKNKLEKIVRQAEEISQQDPSKYIEKYITLLTNIGTIYFQGKDYPMAEEYYRKALNKSDFYYSRADQRRFYIINNLLCTLLSSQTIQNYFKAEKLSQSIKKQLENRHQNHLKEVKALLLSNMSLIQTKKPKTAEKETPYSSLPQNNAKQSQTFRRLK